MNLNKMTKAELINMINKMEKTNQSLRDTLDRPLELDDDSQRRTRIKIGNYYFEILKMMNHNSIWISASTGISIRPLSSNGFYMDILK